MHPKRIEWLETEGFIFWDHYERAYSLGTLTSKTSKNNPSGWENLEVVFNEEMKSWNMLPRSLQQIKEKINNFKTDHKKIKDKELQTGQETQSKPFWFDMVDRFE